MELRGKYLMIVQTDKELQVDVQAGGFVNNRNVEKVNYAVE